MPARTGPARSPGRWSKSAARSSVCGRRPGSRPDARSSCMPRATRRRCARSCRSSLRGRGAIRPTSVFQSASFAHFVALNTDVDNGGGDPTLNPFRSSYWSYVSLVLRSSFDQDLPPWLSRGMAEVFSNTIVRQNQILVGQVIKWHLGALRDRGRPTLDVMLSADRSSPHLTNGDRMATFDATAWALVHYLIFGNGGKHIPISTSSPKPYASAVRPASWCSSTTAAQPRFATGSRGISISRCSSISDGRQPSE